MQEKILKKEIVRRVVEKLKDKKIITDHRGEEFYRRRYDMKYSQEIVTNVIEAFIEVIAEIIEEGDTVKLNGFMILEPVVAEERKRNNPYTGKIMVVPKRYKLKLHPGAKLKEACKRLTERELGGSANE